MNRFTCHLSCLLILSFGLAACQTTKEADDQSGKEISPDPGAVSFPEAKTNPDFVALGPAGQSHTFQSLVTLYIHRSDIQPECPGCLRLRLVLDDKTKTTVGDPSSATGTNGAPGHSPITEKVSSPLAHSATWNFSPPCPGVGAPARAPFSSIWRSSSSPREVQLTISFDSEKCKSTGVALDLYADQCGSTAAECKTQVVRHSFSVPLHALQSLKPWLEDSYPNLAAKKDGGEP